MKIKFSPSKNGFFIVGIHSDIPRDSVDVTKNEHQELMEKQMKGFVIKADSSGCPVAIEMPKKQ